MAAPDLDRDADRSCDIKVWDAATGRELLVLKGHADLVVGLAFSTDGERMVSADSAGWVRLWDATTGREIRAFRSNVGPLWSLAYHPDGRRVALGGEDGTVSLWDVTTGRRLLDFRGSGTRTLLAWRLTSMARTWPRECPRSREDLGYGLRPGALRPAEAPRDHVRRGLRPRPRVTTWP